MGDNMDIQEDSTYQCSLCKNYVEVLDDNDKCEDCVEEVELYE